MVDIPSELRAPRPRDLRHAARLFAKQRSIERSLWLAGAGVGAAFMVWGRLAHGSFFYMAWVSLGVAGFVWSSALYLALNVLAGKLVFRDGILLEGRVTEVKSSRDIYAPAQRRSFVVAGRFVEPGGKAKRFSANTGLVQVEDIGCKVGDVVPVLHLERRPQQLMIWLPGLGLMMAFAKDG